jgi:predicted membrane-bound mannosyltransferase
MKQRIVGGVLALLVVVAAVFRLWEIDTLPPGFHFDESFEGLEAWRILTDPTYRPIFLTGNFGVAPLNAYANAAMFALFGWLGGEAGPTAMRTHRGVGRRARRAGPLPPRL